MTTTRNVTDVQLSLCKEYPIDIRPPHAAAAGVRDAVDNIVELLYYAWDGVRGPRSFHPHSITLHVEDAGLTRIRIRAQLFIPEENS